MRQKTWREIYDKGRVYEEIDFTLLGNEDNKMLTKFNWANLFTSKTVWFNIIMTVLGVTAILQSVATFDKYAQTFLLVGAIGNVILKIWFNNTSIASTPMC